MLHVEPLFRAIHRIFPQSSLLLYTWLAQKAPRPKQWSGVNAVTIGNKKPHSSQGLLVRESLGTHFVLALS